MPAKRHLTRRRPSRLPSRTGIHRPNHAPPQLRLHPMDQAYAIPQPVDTRNRYSSKYGDTSEAIAKRLSVLGCIVAYETTLHSHLQPARTVNQSKFTHTKARRAVVASRISIAETGRRRFAAIEKSPNNLKIPAALDVLQLPRHKTIKSENRKSRP
ncbi:MAG: hypothetical protein ACLPN5_22555 [Roseiarcus sp.]